MFCPRRCHYVVITSHRGCPSEPAARQQVRPRLNAETARCGQRRWTSIRRTCSPPKRSGDKRFCASVFLMSTAQSWLMYREQKQWLLLCFYLFIFSSGNLRTLQGRAGSHRRSATCTKGWSLLFENCMTKLKQLCSLRAHTAALLAFRHTMIPCWNSPIWQRRN